MCTPVWKNLVDFFLDAHTRNGVIEKEEKHIGQEGAPNRTLSFFGFIYMSRKLLDCLETQGPLRSAWKG